MSKTNASETPIATGPDTAGTPNRPLLLRDTGTEEGDVVPDYPVGPEDLSDLDWWLDRDDLDWK